MQERRGYRLYRIGIIALWVIVLAIALAVSDLRHVPWAQVFMFIAIGALCELAPIQLGKDYSYAEITLTLPVVIAAMLLYGFVPVVVVSWCAFVFANALAWMCAYFSRLYQDPSPQTVRGPWYWVKRIFFGKVLGSIGRSWVDKLGYPFRWMFPNLIYNGAHCTVSAAAAGLVYVLAHGKLLGLTDLGQMSGMDWFQTAVAGVVALMTWLFVDAMIQVGASVFYENLPAYTRSLDGFLLRCNIQMKQQINSMLRDHIFLSVLAGVLVYVYVQIGLVAMVVLFVPLYMIRDASQQTFMQIRTYRDTVAALAGYMQRYHPYTRGHLKRVADLSERLAKELKLPASSVMLMPDAGMLHDIGKIGVSDEILDKIGKLTDEEWATIKSHPVKGANIVSHLPYLEKIVDWVKYHHKWVDGSGYPEDTEGNGHVPLEAAIIAVADAFDAMTDDRELALDWVCDTCGYTPENGARPEACPKCNTKKGRVYREPLSLDGAIDQLRRGAGTQFSPPVVKAFLRMVERDGVHLNA